MYAGIYSNVQERSTDRESLEQEYLLCLSSPSIGAVLTELCVNTGYSEGSVRSLLSKILCGKGQGQRKKGAGRKAHADVLDIVADVSAQYGHDRAPKLLRAASRAAASELAPTCSTPEFIMVRKQSEAPVRSSEALLTVYQQPIVIVVHDKESLRLLAVQTRTSTNTLPNYEP
jgi:hypothetical protein